MREVGTIWPAYEDSPHRLAWLAVFSLGLGLGMLAITIALWLTHGDKGGLASLPGIAAPGGMTAPVVWAGLVLTLAAAFVGLLGGWRAWRRRDRAVAAGDLITQEAVPAYLTDFAGRVLARSAAGRPLARVSAALTELAADPASLARQVVTRAALSGATRELCGDAAAAAQVLVARVSGGFYLWRIESGALNAYAMDRKDDVPDFATEYSSWAQIEPLPAAFLALDAGGVIRAANQAARRMLPMPIEPGIRLSMILEGLGRPVHQWVGECVTGQGDGQPQVLHGTGAHRDFHVRVSLTPDGANRGRIALALLSDMSELKSLQAQFVQSQKMQAIGQLTGGVAHDFNNLLTAISGHCDLLLLRHEPSDADYPDLIQIHQNANRAASLVRQLLAYSRKQALMPEVLDLRATLADLTHLLNRLVGERVRLTLDHDPELGPVRLDRQQLEQVVVNLVVNARDAMPGGGPIRIVTEQVRLGEAMERDRARLVAGDYVVVRIRDEGTGIAPDRLTKIFEPFYTTKRPGEGTGLGLSTAYGIVKQSGGFIFVDSALGEGTEFSLWFPAAEGSTVSRAPVVADMCNRPAGEGTVLLVEDEVPVRAFASRALQLQGHRVLEAESAEMALELLEDPGVEIDVIVSDVIMPGKDGPTWVREALVARPDTRVVFVSGYAEEAFSEQKSLIPQSVFLAKPFSLTALIDTVQVQLQDLRKKRDEASDQE